MANIVTTNYFRELISTGQVNLSSDTFYVSLLNNYVQSSTTSTLQSISAWSQVSAFEVSSVNYSAAIISGENISINGNIVVWDANNITWNSVTFSPYGFVIYKNDGVVIGFIEFTSAPAIVVNGSLTIQWNNAGIANIL